MRVIEELTAALSRGEGIDVLWELLMGSEAGAVLTAMQGVRQNPEFHGEGDVYCHTRLVCGALLEEEEFQKLPPREKTGLFLAAVLHDAGKIRTTVLEEGAWKSPRHSSVGSRMAREFLWKTCGLCGTKEAMRLRETVCGLIRFHMRPMHLPDGEEAELSLRRTASLGELAPDFTWRKLCLLATADARGRIAADGPQMRDMIDFCRLMAEEAGCFDGPFLCSDGFTRRAYLSGRRVAPDQFLYDTTWGEVVMLSGLPGVGKDTWISRNLPGLPVISLDTIRKEMGVKPTGDQGNVVGEARERARRFLRERRPFVWNATNLSREIRQKQIRLFEQYQASVKLVYLETGEEVRRERNLARTEAVPEEAVERMLAKTEPPTPEEAAAVVWHSV